MNTSCSGLVTKQSYSLGVAAEFFNILLNPLESSDLVHQAVVGHLRILLGRNVGVEKTYKKNNNETSTNTFLRIVRFGKIK